MHYYAPINTIILFKTLSVAVPAKWWYLLGALYTCDNFKFIKHAMCLYLEIEMLSLNPLESRGNYSATLNNMKLVHWPLMGGLINLVQRGRDCGPAQFPPHCTKC